MNANAIIRASAPFFQKYVLSPEMPAKRHLAMMLLGLCFTAPLLANEVLRIESQAAEYSAQIYIQEEEKGSVPEKEKENDQKRKKLGIGETVILTLVSDKPQLIGDPSQIEWTIEEGENLAFFEDRDKSETTTLIIRKDISAGGPITIKATTEEGREAKIELSAVIPERISAKHRRKSDDRNNPDFNKRGMIIEGMPEDGEQNMAGASAYLELTFLPTDVSFQNIQIIERDGGCLPAPAEDNLVTVHTPNPEPAELDRKNRMFDRIGTQRSVAVLKRYVKWPQKWSWKCNWNMFVEGKDVATIQTENQFFSYDWVLFLEEAITTISKFGCSVSRSTEENNKHSFKPE